MTSNSLPLETVKLSHTSNDIQLLVGLYQQVQNAASLHQQLLAGNTAFEYAFIDASMILSRTHVLAAAFRALNDDLCDRIKSRNVHSEMVFALSPNSNIGEAFRRFGVSDRTTDLLVIKVSTLASLDVDEVQRHLDHNIKGRAVLFSDENLRSMADMDRIRKVYKIASPAAAKRGKSAELMNGDGPSISARDERKVIETQVLGAMALRGAA